MPRVNVLDEILRIAAFAAGSLLAVLLLCEFILKPIWHVILMR